MITSRQIRAARALLGWTQETLADAALVALTALKRLESDRLGVRDTTRDAVRKALEEHGVIFLSSARGLGVMLVDQSAEASATVAEGLYRDRRRSQQS
jgi:transcriptional regulator with XRE-family HTH domain